MLVRGIRGATTVKEDSPVEIMEATRELLKALMKENGFQTQDIAAVIFSATPDLTADYPARAAREMGWRHVPLMCCQEMNVASLPFCIRVLILVNTNLEQNDIKHLYLNNASILRKDL